MWVLFWQCFSIVADELGSIPIHLMAFIAGLWLLAVPVTLVIERAGFRNCPTWLGFVVIALGVALGEPVSRQLGVTPEIVLELSSHFEFELPMIAFQAFAATVIMAGSGFVGQSNKRTRKAWDASPHIGGSAPRSP